MEIWVEREHVVEIDWQAGDYEDETIDIGQI